MRRLMTAAVALILVGFVAVPALGLGGRESLAICHRTQIRGAAPSTWTLLLVGLPAVQAHYDHGDGVPNGEVPGMPGFTFDSTCAPTAAGDAPATTTTAAPTTTTTTTTSTTLPGTVASCFDGAFGTYDLYVGVLDLEDGAALWSSTDGTCSGSEQVPVTVIDGAADRTAARASCALVLGGTADQYFPMRVEPLFPEAPNDWWLCF